MVKRFLGRRVTPIIVALSIATSMVTGIPIVTGAAVDSPAITQTVSIHDTGGTTNAASFTLQAGSGFDMVKAVEADQKTFMDVSIVAPSGTTAGEIDITMTSPPSGAGTNPTYAWATTGDAITIASGANDATVSIQLDVTKLAYSGHYQDVLTLTYDDDGLDPAITYKISFLRTAGFTISTFQNGNVDVFDINGKTNETNYLEFPYGTWLNGTAGASVSSVADASGICFAGPFNCDESKKLNNDEYLGVGFEPATGYMIGSVKLDGVDVTKNLKPGTIKTNFMVYVLKGATSKLYKFEVEFVPLAGVAKQGGDLHLMTGTRTIDDLSTDNDDGLYRVAGTSNDDEYQQLVIYDTSESAYNSASVPFKLLTGSTAGSVLQSGTTVKYKLDKDGDGTYETSDTLTVDAQGLVEIAKTALQNNSIIIFYTDTANYVKVRYIEAALFNITINKNGKNTNSVIMTAAKGAIGAGTLNSHTHQTYAGGVELAGSSADTVLTDANREAFDTAGARTVDNPSGDWTGDTVTFTVKPDSGETATIKYYTGDNATQKTVVVTNNSGTITCDNGDATCNGTCSGHTNGYVVTVLTSNPEVYGVDVVFATVSTEPTDTQKVQADAAALTWDDIDGNNESQDLVIGNLATLPTTGSVHGSSIEWTSSNTNVIAINGTVNRPEATGSDTAVTLTATITSGLESTSKPFTLTVLKVPALNSSTLADINLNNITGAKAAYEGYYTPADYTKTLTITANVNLSDDIDVTSNDTNIEVAKTDNVTWTVKPKSGLSAGAYTATLTITGTYDNGLTNNKDQIADPSNTVNVTFTVTAAPSVTFGTAELDLTTGKAPAVAGYYEVNTYEQELTITNNSDSSMTFEVTSGTEANIVVSEGASSSNIANNASHTFKLKPASAELTTGGDNASVITVVGKINDVKAFQATKTVKFTVTAATQSIAMTYTHLNATNQPISSGNTITLGNIPKDATAANYATTLKITNNGNFELAGLSVSAGSGATVASGESAALAANADREVTITPNFTTSTVNNAYSSTITIASSDDNVADITLTLTYTITDAVSDIVPPEIAGDIVFTHTTDTTGTLAITFNEPMDNSIVAATNVSLSAGAVDAVGAWSNDDKTITYNVSNLTANTTITATINNFQDKATNPNVMVQASKTFVVKNNVVTLSALTTDLTLDTSFASATHTYTATVAADKTTANISAVTLTDTNASFSINSEDSTIPKTVNLTQGGNTTITITVTAENGVTTQNYTITVTRPHSYSMSHDISGSAISYSVATGYVNTSSTQTVTVTNTGSDSLAVSAALTTDTSFTVSPASASINAGQTQDFVITPVSGLTASTYTDTLTLSADHSVAPQTISISLQVLDVTAPNATVKENGALALNTAASTQPTKGKWITNHSPEYQYCVVGGNGSLTLALKDAPGGSALTDGTQVYYKIDGGAIVPATTTNDKITINGLTNGNVIVVFTSADDYVKIRYIEVAMLNVSVTGSGSIDSLAASSGAGGVLVGSVSAYDLTSAAATLNGIVFDIAGADASWPGDTIKFRAKPTANQIAIISYLTGADANAKKVVVSYDGTNYHCNDSGCVNCPSGNHGNTGYDFSVIMAESKIYDVSVTFVDLAAFNAEKSASGAPTLDESKYSSNNAALYPITSDPEQLVAYEIYAVAGAAGTVDFFFPDNTNKTIYYAVAPAVTDLYACGAFVYKGSKYVSGTGTAETSKITIPGLNQRDQIVFFTADGKYCVVRYLATATVAVTLSDNNSDVSLKINEGGTLSPNKDDKWNAGKPLVNDDASQGADFNNKSALKFLNEDAMFDVSQTPPSSTWGGDQMVFTVKPKVGYRTTVEYSSGSATAKTVVITNSANAGLSCDDAAGLDANGYSFTVQTSVSKEYSVTVTSVALATGIQTIAIGSDSLSADSDSGTNGLFIKNPDFAFMVFKCGTSQASWNHDYQLILADAFASENAVFTFNGNVSSYKINGGNFVTQAPANTVTIATSAFADGNIITFDNGLRVLIIEAAKVDVSVGGDNSTDQVEVVFESGNPDNDKTFKYTNANGGGETALGTRHVEFLEDGDDATITITPGANRVISDLVVTKGSTVVYKLSDATDLTDSHADIAVTADASTGSVVLDLAKLNVYDIDVTFAVDATTTPQITEISADPYEFDSAGGTSKITIVGANLDGNTVVTVYDEEDNDVTSTVTVDDIEGTGNSQTVDITFPANASTTDDMVYTVEAGGEEVDVTVSKAPGIVTLSNITVGGTAVAGFAASTKVYNVEVANSTESVIVAATATDANAVVTVNGTANSKTITPPAAGAAAVQVSIVVTAANGLATDTYTVNITRAHKYDFKISKESHIFEAQNLGYETAPAALTVEVENMGTDGLKDVGVDLEGADKVSFALVKTGLPATLAKGAKGSFTVQPVKGLTAGEHEVTIKVTAKPNKDGSQAITKTISATFTVNAPIFTSVSVDKAELESEGGAVVVGVVGQFLNNGIAVEVFDGTEKVTADWAKDKTTTLVVGKQQVTITFPENTSTTADKVYTIKAGGKEAKVTVKKAPVPDPVFTDLSVDKDTLTSSGGAVIVTVEGENLVDGIAVEIFNGTEKVTADWAKGKVTTGNDTEQTVSITFPSNTSTVTDSVYTVKAGDMEAATVTVSKAPIPDPVFTGISVDRANLTSSGGTVIATVEGENLVDGIAVEIFNGTEKVTATWAIDKVTTGNDTEQTVSITFPSNTSTITNRVYTVKAGDMETTVTVARATSSGGGGGGGGGGGSTGGGSTGGGTSSGTDKTDTPAPVVTKDESGNTKETVTETKKDESGNTVEIATEKVTDTSGNTVTKVVETIKPTDSKNEVVVETVSSGSKETTEVAVVVKDVKGTISKSGVSQVKTDVSDIIALAEKAAEGKENAKIAVKLDDNTLLSRVNNEKVKDVQIIVEGAQKDAVDVQVNPDVINKAKELGKEVKVALKDDSGVNSIIWNIKPDGDAETAAVSLSVSAAKATEVEAVDTALNLAKASTANESNGSAASEAVVLSLGKNLPKAADVTIKVTSMVADAKIEPGQTVYVYKFNATTGKFEATLQNQARVTKSGNVTIKNAESENYVILTEPLDPALVTPVTKQAKSSLKKSEVKVGGSSKINTVLPQGIKQVNEFDRNSKDLQVKTTYESSDPSVATVNEDGTITYHKEGKATIRVVREYSDGKKSSSRLNLSV